MQRKISLIILIGFFISMFTATALSAETVTFVAVVNDDFTLVDENGQVYLIAESDVGDELAENIGAKVSVKGQIEDSADGPIIHVESFEIMEDA